MGIISEYRKENRKHSNYKEPVRKETGNLHSKILDLSVTTAATPKSQRTLPMIEIISWKTIKRCFLSG